MNSQSICSFSEIVLFVIASGKVSMSAPTKKNLYLEFRKPSVASLITSELRLQYTLVQLEVVFNEKVYLSRSFTHSSTAMPLLLRIPLQDLGLPLKNDIPVVLRLYAHMMSPISVLMGVQDFTISSSKPNIAMQIPITGKANNSRVYNCEVELIQSSEELPELFDKNKPSGQSAVSTRLVYISHIKNLIRQHQAVDPNLKSPKRLLYSVAIVMLNNSKVKHFEQPLRLTIDDEFCDLLLSDSYIFCNLMEPSSKVKAAPNAPPETKKHGFIDFKKNTTIITRASPSNNMPNLYFSAVTILPNGNYIMAGGLSKDTVVNHQGIYYFNPIQGFYIKIAEIPFNLNSHEIHYHDGMIYIFGGIDGKEDKPSTTDQVGKKSGRLYTFDLSNREWAAGAQQVSKSVEKCSSILFNDHFICNKGGEALEIYSFTKKKWSAITCKPTILLNPSFFFEMGGELYICHRKSKDDDTTYSFGKIILKENPDEETYKYLFLGSCTLNTPIDIQIKSDLVDGKKEYSLYFTCLLPTGPKNIIRKLVIGPNFQWSSLRETVFKEGFNTITEYGLEKSIFKMKELCSTSLPKERPASNQICIVNMKKVLEAEADGKLKEIQAGIGHSWVPYNTGQVLLLGYFKKNINSDDYVADISAYTIRKINSALPQSVLRVPSCLLTTVGHSAIRVGNTVFIVGGLTLLDKDHVFTADSVNSLQAQKDLLEPTGRIMSYRTSTHVWKTIDFLPEAVYGCTLNCIDNVLYIAGGMNKDNLPVNKILTFDLKTYTLKTKIGLEGSLPRRLQSFHFGDLLYIGSADGNEVTAYNYKQNTSYSESSDLFKLASIHSTEVQGEDKVLLTYSIKDRPSNLLKKTVTQTELMDLLKGKNEELKQFLSSSTDTQEAEGEGTSVAVYKTNEDFFGLDQIDHSRTYSDFNKKNRFVVLEESHDFMTHPGEYIFSEDRVIKLPPPAQASSTSQGFKKGIPELNFPRNCASCTLPACTTFICGGERVENGKLVSSNRCWNYDPISRTYSVLHKMSQPRVYHAITRYQNYIYCFGGRQSSSSGPVATCERYNISQGIWETLPDLPAPRAKMSCTTLFNKIYLIGGEDEKGKATSTIFIFDILTQIFELCSSYEKTLKLQDGLKSHVSINTCFNTILVAGGENSEDKPNMNLYLLEFKTGYKTPETRVVSQALYPHVNAHIACIDGTTLIIGGNDINGSETFCTRGEVLKDLPSFRNAKIGSRFIFSEIKNELHVADTFLHCNPKFGNLYIFGLDHKKEIWK
jgi:hypothetical protein